LLDNIQSSGRCKNTTRIRKYAKMVIPAEPQLPTWFPNGGGVYVGTLEKIITREPETKVEVP